MENKTDIKTEEKIITFEELLNAKTALQNYFDSVVSGATACKIIKFVNYVEEKEKYYGAIMSKLLGKYVERDDKGEFVKTEDGKGFELIKETKNEYWKSVAELESNLTTDFKATISVDEFSELKIKMGDMYYIMPILKED